MTRNPPHNKTAPMVRLPSRMMPGSNHEISCQARRLARM